jgi:hypothetical protein
MRVKAAPGGALLPLSGGLEAQTAARMRSDGEKFLAPE